LTNQRVVPCRSGVDLIQSEGDSMFRLSQLRVRAANINIGA